MTSGYTSGYSQWLIVLSSFMMYFLVHCALRSLPILFVTLVTYFNSGEAATAWIPALQEFMFKGSSVIVAPIIKKVGCRTVALVGTVFAAVGYICGMFCGSIAQLVLSVGILSGIGMGMMVLSSLVCVQYYFTDKRRSMASSLAIFGNSLGTLFGSPFTRYMMKLFTWRGALFIQAGILLNGFVAALLLMPKPKPQLDIQETTIEESPLNANSDGKQSSYGANSVHPSINRTDIDETSLDEDFYQKGESGAKGNEIEKMDVTAESIDEDKEEKKTFCELFRASLGSFCSKDLMHNPAFILYIITNVFVFFGYVVPITYLPERAVHYGIRKLDASFLISIVAISNIATRLGSGFITSEVVRFWVYFGIAVLSGFVNILTPFFTVYWSMCVYAVFLGLCHGSFLPLKVVIVVDLAGTKHLETAVAWSFACVSIPVLFGSPFAGAIIQLTGNYDLPFVLGGASQLLGAVILLGIPVLHKTKMKYTRLK